MELPIQRRHFLRAGFALGTGGTLAVLAHAQDKNAPAPDVDFITPETDTAINRGLAYLASTQAADGSFVDSRSMVGNSAITGLAGLALMAGGHQPGRGKFGAAVARATDYVVGRANGASPPGYLNNNDQQLSHGAMYQHGFGSLFLSEVQGMVSDPEKQRRLRDTLEKAIQLIINSQNRDGGWRYEPRPNQADISVTVAQLMALRAARNAGIFVPKERIDKCVDYILACQQRDGGFCYIKGQGFAGSQFPRSAAAVVGLFCAGHYDRPEVERGLRYLYRFLPGNRSQVGGESRSEHYYYGHYYAALAMWTAGGNYWAEWFPAIRDELLFKARSAPNGIWTDWHGNAYATAMACIILQLPNNYLPIMQK